MLPIRMMKVSPIASVSGTAAELARRTRLRSSMKLGLAMAISTHSTTSTASGARLRQRLPPNTAAMRPGRNVISVVRSMSETDFRGSVWIVKKPLPVC